MVFGITIFDVYKITKSSVLEKYICRCHFEDMVCDVVELCNLKKMHLMSKWPFTQRNDTGTEDLGEQIENHKQKSACVWPQLLGDRNKQPLFLFSLMVGCRNLTGELHCDIQYLTSQVANHMCYTNVVALAMSRHRLCTLFKRTSTKCFSLFIKRLFFFFYLPLTTRTSCSWMIDSFS